MSSSDGRYSYSIDNDNHKPHQQQQRRSKREHKSTLVYVDGHAILKENNYVVTGDRYIRDAYETEDPKKKKQRVLKSLSETNASKPKAPQAPRTTPAYEIHRRQHNERVQAMMKKNLGLRWKFWTRHLDLLSHFCEPKVLADVKDRQRYNNLLPDYHPLNLVSTPKAVQATLRDYQQQGLTFMANMHNQNLSMILGDEMGLGKTLQTISFLCWLKETQGATGPSLVVCPLSVLSSWCNELRKWAPSLQFFRLHASGAEEQANQKHELLTNAFQYDVILTTYEMAKIPTLKSFFARQHFHYLVLDEGHKIKGHSTLIAQAVRSIHAGNKLILTGTPLQNNMVELWSLLEFLYPQIFTTAEPFAKAFDLSENHIDKQFLEQAHKLLDLIMLRRLKTKVETFIPPKLETKVYCPLSKTQTFFYRSLLMKDLSGLASAENSNNMNANNHNLLKALFMQLRKCCNHPFVFEGAEVDPAQTTLEELVAASGKLSVLDMLLQKLFKNNHRAVIFSQFTGILDIIEDYCQMRGWKFCRLDGSTEPARRSYYIRRFNEPNSPFFLFLVSTRSGGMGLNLQTADTCILFDSDWNPQSDIQAMGRVHRIGQTKTVHVYRLVSSGTIEERMLQRAEKKLLLEMVNRESQDDSGDNEQARGLSAAELLEDIKFGSQAVFGDSANNELPSWEDIDVITDRTRKESDSVGKLHGNAQHSAKEFDATKAFGETQNFGGTDFRKIRKQQEKAMKDKIPSNLQGIGHLWQEISKLKTKRERKNRIMMVASNGSGYGAPVPVLKSNDYDLENGESSVFDRELKKDKKAKFEVAKKKQGVEFENQDFCQVCGDGGSLVCCPRCPCSVHVRCVGLTRAKDFHCCTHHRCSGCGKKREGAGGLLFPCQICANAYCEDCVPKHGVEYMEKVPRFDALGYNVAKSKVVYITCSKQCRHVAKQDPEYMYCPPVAANQSNPKPIDVSFGFGAAKSLEEQISDLQKEQEEGLEKASRRLRARRPQPAPPVVPKKVKCDEYIRWEALPTSERAVEKICLLTGNVLAAYSSLHDAARSIQRTDPTLRVRLHKQSPAEYGKFQWKLTSVSEARKPIVPSDQVVEVIEIVTPRPVRCLVDYREWMALPEWKRAVEKIWPATGEVQAAYASIEDAANSMQNVGDDLQDRLKALNPASYRNFLWKLTNISQVRKPIQFVPANQGGKVTGTTSTPEVIDLTADTPPVSRSLPTNHYVPTKPIVKSPVQQIVQKPLAVQKPAACQEYREWMSLPVCLRAIERICPITGRVLAAYGSVEDGAHTMGKVVDSCLPPLKLRNPAACRNFWWKLTSTTKVRAPIQIVPPHLFAQVIVNPPLVLNPAGYVNAVPRAMNAYNVPTTTMQFQPSAGLTWQSNVAKVATVSAEACPEITPESQGDNLLNVRSPDITSANLVGKFNKVKDTGSGNISPKIVSRLV